MESGQQENTVRRRALRIVIPIAIVIAIGAIGLTKNAQRKPSSTPATDRNVDDFALHVTEQLDLDKLRSYGLPIMIDFGADSCEPCKAMAPVLAKLNKELRGKAFIKFVDVWKYPELAEGYPLSVIPTQVFFDKDGKPYRPSNPEASKMQMWSLKENGQHVFTTHEGGMTEEMILQALKEMGLQQ